MDLVSHAKPGQPLRVIEALPAVDAEILRSYWRAGYARVGCRVEDVARILAELKLKNAWLACDCTDRDNATELPILFARLAADGRLSLARNGRREMHHPSCEFAWKEGELGVRHPSQCEPTQVEDPLQLRPYCLHDGQIALQNRLLAGGINGHLAAVANHLVRHAGLNIFDGSYRHIQQQGKKMQEAGKELTASHPDGCPVWTGIGFLTEGWAHQHWERSPSKGGTATLGQGYIVLRSTAIRPNAVQAKDGWIDLGCRIAVENGTLAMTEQTGEFLVVIALVNDQAEGKARALNALALALAPRHICPVASPLEANALAILSIFAQEANQRFAVGGAEPLVTIEKPLHLDPEWGGANPFFVRAGGRILVVDTVVTHETGDAAQRRQHGREALRAIGPVFVDYRLGVEKRIANHRALNYLHGWLRAAGIAGYPVGRTELANSRLQDSQTRSTSSFNGGTDHVS